jgi:hypothetical protein
MNLIPPPAGYPGGEGCCERLGSTACTPRSPVGNANEGALAAYLAGRERSDTEARWGELVPPYQDLAASIG